MQRAIRIFIMLSLSVCMEVSVSTQEKEIIAKKSETKVKPKEVTLTGRILDSECYMKMGDRGSSDDHHQCAESCAKGGIPLTFLEDQTNDLYLTANEGMSMKSVNEKLLPYLDDKVTIKGKVIERSGAKLLVISSIEKTE